MTNLELLHDLNLRHPRLEGEFPARGFWIFSDLLQVLTFFALTVICLGLSILYYKFEDRLKEWL